MYVIIHAVDGRQYQQQFLLSGASIFMIQGKIAQYLVGKKFVQKIMEKPADLSEFKERPTPRLICGLILMVLSFIMGWPAIFALSFLAIWLQKPLIAVIGCPTTYGLSYVVFIFGAWMARTPYYLGILTRYTLQSFIKKILQGNQ